MERFVVCPSTILHSNERLLFFNEQSSPFCKSVRWLTCEFLESDEIVLNSSSFVFVLFVTGRIVNLHGRDPEFEPQQDCPHYLSLTAVTGPIVARIQLELDSIERQCQKTRQKLWESFRLHCLGDNSWTSVQ